MVEFQFEGHTYIVKRTEDKFVYRDKDHLGGRWADAQKTADNTSLKAGFRKLLKESIAKVLRSFVDNPKD